MEENERHNSELQQELAVFLSKVQRESLRIETMNRNAAQMRSLIVDTQRQRDIFNVCRYFQLYYG